MAGGKAYAVAVLLHLDAGAGDHRVVAAGLAGLVQHRPAHIAQLEGFAAAHAVERAALLARDAAVKDQRVIICADNVLSEPIDGADSISLVLHDHARAGGHLGVVVHGAVHREHLPVRAAQDQRLAAALAVRRPCPLARDAAVEDHGEVVPAQRVGAEAVDRRHLPQVRRERVRAEEQRSANAGS